MTQHCLVVQKETQQQVGAAATAAATCTAAGCPGTAQQRTHLDQRSDDSQASEAQVLEGPRLADGVEEGVQEQRDVRCSEGEGGPGTRGKAGRMRRRQQIRRHFGWQRLLAGQAQGSSAHGASRLPACLRALCWQQVDDTEVINFLLSTEIIPLCLRTMETGSELSKTVATFIVQKILLDNVRRRAGRGGREQGGGAAEGVAAGYWGGESWELTTLRHSQLSSQAGPQAHPLTHASPPPPRPPALAGWSELHLRHC